MKTKLLGFLLALVPLAAGALVPVEGIILGDADEAIQSDPLRFIFSDIYDRSRLGENKKARLYHATYLAGEALVSSCTYLGAPTYASVWQEKQAQRSVAATLQYIGLDTAIKAIGAYAKTLEVPEADFLRLKSNLVRNYCSTNVTIFARRSIERALLKYYETPLNDIIPSVTSSPFVPENLRTRSEARATRSREFDLAIRNFRAFCSWGADTSDYRLLTPYLNNRYIMALVVKNLSGLQDRVDDTRLSVETVKSDQTVQVLCDDLVCRQRTGLEFRQGFPVSVGSTGIATDLAKLYCHHFRFQDPPQTTIPEVRAWLKAQDLEDPIRETSQFIAFMTGVPDFMNGAESYQDLPLITRSSIDERWTSWSKKVLGTFSQDLLYEEALKVRVEPKTAVYGPSGEGFGVNLSVTLGELDRLMPEHDKLTAAFQLKLSKNFLRELRTKTKSFEDEVDLEGKKRYVREVGRYLTIQLREKEALFLQPIWNESFGELLAQELVSQARSYRGSFFDSYQEEVLSVPVRFSYGIFAIGYLRYRADVAQGRLKLKL